jgi:hypothetical protein
MLALRAICLPQLSASRYCVPVPSRLSTPLYLSDLSSFHPLNAYHCDSYYLRTHFCLTSSRILFLDHHTPNDTTVVINVLFCSSDFRCLRCTYTLLLANLPEPHAATRERSAEWYTIHISGNCQPTYFKLFELNVRRWPDAGAILSRRPMMHDASWTTYVRLFSF